MEYKYEELEKKYAALPADIRGAMSSMDIAQSVENIGKSHSLHVDQIGQLMDEVSFIMLGLMHPSDFISNIQKSLEIDNQKAQEITKDINEKIFRPIKVSLLSIHGVKQQPETEEPKEAPSKEQALEEIEDPIRARGSEEPASNGTGKEAPILSQTKSEEQNRESSTSEPNQNDLGEVGKYRKLPTTKMGDETPLPEIAKKDIVEEKLGGEFKIPSTEKEVATPEPPKVSTPKDKPIDPYREPIELE